MAVTPISDMAFRPGNMSEETEYLRQEMLTIAKGIEGNLKNKADQQEFSNLVKLIEKALVRLEDIELHVRIHNRKTLSETCTVEDIAKSLINVSQQVDSIKDAMIALSAKLDANVNVGENDHEAVVRENLK